ncbi:hypothetical protein LCGC14_0277700 [marine sediment metagenome]|uniref:Uncharacterized protein n=1 Tax=marine sediment metagenome TaxID=412755 RepID=A0A0F9WI65_9ZZZZ
MTILISRVFAAAALVVCIPLSNAHADVSITRQILERLPVQLKPRPDHGLVLELVRQRHIQLACRLDDLGLVRSLLNLVEQDRRQFPTSAWMSSMR